MRVWWDSISLRERIIVAAAVMVALYIAVDMLLVQPFTGSFEQVQENTIQAQDDLSWMQQAVTRIPAGSSGKSLQGSIVSYVDGQISRAGFKSNLQQMTPLQDDAVRVRLRDVEFDKLLTFFAAVNARVVIDEVRILPQGSAGLVNASLVLKKQV